MPPPVADYAETIVSAMTSTCEELGMDLPRLHIEPGRSIVGPAGVALYSVGAIKDIPGVRKYVSVDGGMGDNIRPALYQASYEVVAAGKADREPVDAVTIAGKFCESGDILATDVMLPELEAGDLLAIPGVRRLQPRHGQQLQPQSQAAHGPGQRRPEPPHPPPGKLPGLDEHGRGVRLGTAAETHGPATHKGGKSWLQQRKKWPGSFKSNPTIAPLTRSYASLRLLA